MSTKRVKATRDKVKYQAPCERCGRELYQTQGHIVPRWLTKRLHLLDLGLKVNPNKNSRCICKRCNQDEKGGVVVDHEVGLMFLLDLREAINKEINKVYGVHI